MYIHHTWHMYLLKIQIYWFDGLFIWLLCICSYTHLLVGLFICSLIYLFIYLSLIDSSINLFTYISIYLFIYVCMYAIRYKHSTWYGGFQPTWKVVESEVSYPRRACTRLEIMAPQRARTPFLGSRNSKRSPSWKFITCIDGPYIHACCMHVYS